MSGPTWLPPKQPEPARAPQGRAIPRGTPGPLLAHGAGAPCRQGGPSPRKPGCRDRLVEQHAGRAEWGSGSCATATRATGIR
uniref:Thyroid hormone receptor interactor 6 n=1 Tax=Macaca nemestrina TaxID=9545 RepID=A0A2K6DBF5_MACNE